MSRSSARFALVSVVIPAREEEHRITLVIEAVTSQTNVGAPLEIIVVDDGSSDHTARLASEAGAKVIQLDDPRTCGNPARARNIGAKESHGDPIVFLDADCVPDVGWLEALLSAHDKCATTVGGALDLPPDLDMIARSDYYCSCYFIHSLRSASWVPHHPPNNISVRRSAFMSTSGFTECAPLSYTNEERHWQAELRRANHGIYFEPKAIVYHYNRPGFGNLLRRSYRWGYTALEAKSETGSTRAAWIFARPKLLLILTPIIPFALTAHIVASWARVGAFEPILLTPIILLSRIAYVTGMVVGGMRWLRARSSHSTRGRPSPRWQ